MSKKLLLLLALPVLCSAQSIDLAVTQANIDQTVCVKGYTKTVRPPVSYTNKIKRLKMDAQGLPVEKMREYELDHIVSLELGGAPRDPANFMLQPWNGADGARSKDVIENKLHKAVCTHKMTLADAQHCIGTNWKECVK